MTEFPETRESLLVRVRTPENREAWEEFVQIYRPVIYRIARNRGLQDADAQDLAQQVLIAVSSAIATWEKSSQEIRFRHWLRRVARNAIVNALTRKPRDQAVGGTSIQTLLTEQPVLDQQSEEEIELEYRREIYLRASAQIQVDIEPETWQVFQLSVIENRDLDEVALKMGKSIGAVYVARSRVMKRLRETIREFEEKDQ